MARVRGYIVTRLGGRRRAPVSLVALVAHGAKTLSGLRHAASHRLAQAVSRNFPWPAAQPILGYRSTRDGMDKGYFSEVLASALLLLP